MEILTVKGVSYRLRIYGDEKKFNFEYILLLHFYLHLFFTSLQVLLELLEFRWLF